MTIGLGASLAIIGLVLFLVGYVTAGLVLILLGVVLSVVGR